MCASAFVQNPDREIRRLMSALGSKCCYDAPSLAKKTKKKRIILIMRGPNWISARPRYRLRMDSHVMVGNFYHDGSLVLSAFL